MRCGCAGPYNSRYSARSPPDATHRVRHERTLGRHEAVSIVASTRLVLCEGALMSIWASHDPIGTEVRSDRARDFRGDVLSFATGWSSHYPSTGGDVEQPAPVRLAIMPRWCVPGHEDEEDFESTGPWVRVDLEGWRYIDGQAPESRSFNRSFWMRTRRDPSPRISSNGSTRGTSTRSRDAAASNGPTHDRA